ncbi:MAG: phosphoribosylanthranilate isomerase [Verrucomicrobia bacterium]|jgi:phosphoribosylanthranilate isomerase|nr:phosphoribosylanthranilate isomerase [Verrucomicrobiota bacterium]
MSVKVKICGITNLADAQVAIEAGADMLGFVVCEASPRFVTVEKITDIARQLPPHIVKAGVFVNPTEELVTQAIAGCGLNLLQFHGDETPDYCLQFGVMSMKAFRIRDVESLKALLNYQTDAWLLDAFAPGERGGTGAKFNWDLAIEAKKFGRPIFLAGGLTPENVAAAVRQVQPFGVDVSSGVESAPGKKDAGKIRSFIQAVRSVS